jgi:hypothetical protein
MGSRRHRLVAALLGIIAVIGALWPRDHVVAMTARIPASPLYGPRSPMPARFPPGERT